MARQSVLELASSVTIRTRRAELAHGAVKVGVAPHRANPAPSGSRERVTAVFWRVLDGEFGGSRRKGIEKMRARTFAILTNAIVESPAFRARLAKGLIV